MIEKLSDLSRTEYKKVRARQVRKRMTTYFDKDGHLCYDSDELVAFKPKRSGRPPKR